MANRLGQALRYVTDAMHYASVPFRGAPRPTIPMAPWGDALATMADRQRWDQTNTVNIESALRLAVTSAWTYAAIKLIADRVGSEDARPVVKRRTGEKLVDVNDHPFEQLQRRPNSLMTSDFLYSYTAWWIELLGNGYIFISTQAPGLGEPEELWPIPANMVRPLPETLRRSRLTGGQCIDFEYNVNGTKFTLPGENMIHFRLPNPFDYWNGLSPLSASMMSIKIDHSEQSYVHSYYTEDNAIPPAIISLPAETNPVDFEVAKEQIRSQFAGKHRTAITRAGDLSVQVIQQTLASMEHVATRKFNREEIFLVYGVPEGMLTGGVSGDSRLATEIAFTRNTVQPLLNRFASEFTANIAPYYGPDIVIAPTSIIPQDRALDIQEYNTYAQDRTVNENREHRNLPPIDVWGVMDEINTELVRQGREPVELSDASLALMINLPVRLHPFISSNTFTSATPPESANIPQPPDVGDLPGMWGPENFTTDQAVRSAIALGIATELRRWEKVALREARDGRDPSLRPFHSPVLSDYDLSRIHQRLAGASEGAVKDVFVDELARTTHTPAAS